MIKLYNRDNRQLFQHNPGALPGDRALEIKNALLLAYEQGIEISPGGIALIRDHFDTMWVMYSRGHHNDYTLRDLDHKEADMTLIMEFPCE